LEDLASLPNWPNLKNSDRLLPYCLIRSTLLVEPGTPVVEKS
jgi:hypothetical protein